MTTPATEILQDAELEAWFRGEVEKPCESRVRTNNHWAPCQNNAEYVASLYYPRCGRSVTRLICGRCKEGLAMGTYGCRVHQSDGRDIAVAKFIDRLRGAA